MSSDLIASDKTTREAARHLSNDKVLAPLISRYGTVTYRPHNNYYRELVESIIGQQLSVKAAASINRRFVELFGGRFPTPEEILAHPTDSLRSAGLSGAKARYVGDLAARIAGGSLDLDHISNLPNHEVITELTAVKGIGEWTAHMFLIFSLGRMDVLAHGDLGVRTGMMRQYRLASLPTPQEVAVIARENSWHPYESAACWYLWQSLDNEPKSHVI